MHIDVFHDTVCPWCRIGKKHLQIALDQWEGEPATIAYRTFFLNEDIPAEGYNFREYMRAKGGGLMDLEYFFDAPRRMGQQEGVNFNFENITAAPNTVMSHRLIMLTPEENKVAMIDALYKAYFEDAQDIGKLDVLVTIAEAQGFERDVIKTLLEGDAAREEVLAEANTARLMGITGVPFFVINQKYGISGAQPPEVFLQVFERLASGQLVG